MWRGASAFARQYILDIIADEWTEKEFSISKCITERSPEEEQEYLEQAEFYATMPAPTEEDLIREEKWREEYFNYQCVEGRKSKLLNAIYEYITYQNGCRLESVYRSEELTDERSINIGIGKDKIVKFPSAESDELFEFMLMQKVIDALKNSKKHIKIIRRKGKMQRAIVISLLWLFLIDCKLLTE